MALPARFVRSMSIAIPVFTAAALFGLIEGIFKVGLTENLMKTGLTLATVLGILNVWLVYLIYKRRIS